METGLRGPAGDTRDLHCPRQASASSDLTAGMGNLRLPGAPWGHLERTGRRGCHPRFARGKTDTERNEAVPRSR